jgi:hypothetical protein
MRSCLGSEVGRPLYAPSERPTAVPSGNFSTDLAVHAGMGVGPRRHHLKRDVVQPPHLQQMFELLSPHHCASDLPSQRRLFQHEADGGERYGLSPMRVGYRPVGHVFRPEVMAPEERTYFMERGVWDDWWQRCRLPDHTDRSPSEQSAVPARGYLEVRL